MVDYAWMAKRSLLTYVERGEQALEALAGGDDARFETLMAKRQRAFQRLQMIDAAAASCGLDLLQADPALAAVFGGARELNARLDTALKAAYDQAGRDSQRLREGRRGLGGYRLGSGSSRFTITA